MALRGPNPEDQRKLHAEINQIGNQRFLLTTLALTSFGLLIAWMVPRPFPSPGNDLGAFPFAISTILSLLLFGIYIWSHLLKNTLRIFTSYLVDASASQWEMDLIEFRLQPYFAHTSPQSLVFLFLNLIGVLFPFLLAAIFSLTISSAVGVGVSVSVGLMTELIIYLMGVKGLFDAEATIVKRWRTLNGN